MLHFIRERVQGWIAWTIVILLIIPFALWGINQYFGGAGPLVVATVNGKEISQQAHQQAFLLQRDRMREMLGKQYNPDVFDKRIKQQALDDLIEKEILYQNAEEEGFRVSSSSVIDTIRQIEAFQSNGVFSKEQYVQQLRAQGQTPAGFEQRVHHAILTQQLYTGLTASAIVTKKELDRIESLQEQQRDISYLTLATANYKDPAIASDEAIKKYYDANQLSYQTAEKVSIEYIELSASELSKDIPPPSEDQLKQFYNDRKSQFGVPEERRSSHILIAVKEGAEKSAIEAARNKAQEVYKKAKSGENFAKLAKEYSDDPGSSKLGGDIGFITKEKGFDPSFDAAMFGLKIGEISEPVLSAFGFHIIKLDEIHTEKSKSFEEVRGTLVNEYQQDQANKKYYEISDKLTNLAYEVPTTLADAAGAINHQIKTSELFERSGGAGIAANPRVTASAFSNEVLREGYNSEPIEIGENHIIVLRRKDHKEPTQRPLDEVKDAIKKTLIEEDARNKTNQAAKALEKRLLAGEAVEKVAQELKLEWKKAGLLKRTDRTIDTAIAQEAFKLPHPKEGKAVFGSVALNNGDQAVVSVSRVVGGDPAKADASQTLTLERGISGARGESDFAGLLSGLKQAASIVLQQDNL